MIPGILVDDNDDNDGQWSIHEAVGNLVSWSMVTKSFPSQSIEVLRI